MSHCHNMFCLEIAWFLLIKAVRTQSWSCFINVMLKIPCSV